MVSTFWLNAMNGLAMQWGITPELMAVIVGFFAAIGAACAFGMGTKIGGEKHSIMAVAVFFLFLCVEAAIGLVDWVFVIVPAVIVGAYEWGHPA